jgi:hypothetical protein
MTERAGICEVIIPKHREGPTGSVDLYWKPDIVTFTKPRTNKRFADEAIKRKRRPKRQQIRLADGSLHPVEIARNRARIAEMEAAVRAGKIRPVYLDSAGRRVR